MGCVGTRTNHNALAILNNNSMYARPTPPGWLESTPPRHVRLRIVTTNTWLREVATVPRNHVLL